jgi:hypothetical protein
MAVASGVGALESVGLTPRRRVSIRRDDGDFVVVFQPDDIVVFRHNEANALRKVCRSLRWDIVSDVAADPANPASW